eukprot:364870-Chlamydomonas_euryale.AAC.15
MNVLPRRKRIPLKEETHPSQGRNSSLLFLRTLTAALCPLSVATHAKLARSHSRIVSSLDPVATLASLGENEAQRTASE